MARKKTAEGEDSERRRQRKETTAQGEDSTGGRKLHWWEKKLPEEEDIGTGERRRWSYDGGTFLIFYKKFLVSLLG